LLGRDEEIDLLLRRWSRAKAGDGQIVLITGEPGIGKSRLCAELEERLHTETHLRRRYSCSRYHQDRTCSRSSTSLAGQRVSPATIHPRRG
jgi:predicted ATPase